MILVRYAILTGKLNKVKLSKGVLHGFYRAKKNVGGTRCSDQDETNPLLGTKLSFLK